MSENTKEEVDSGAEPSGWTQKNLEKLLSSLKDSIPVNEKTRTYIRGMKAVNWDKVAFPPFSAEECKDKWNSMMVKMRRYRSLPELLDEAEDVLSDPVRHKNLHPEYPKPPVPPKKAYIREKMSSCNKKHPGLPVGQICKKLSRKYDQLPEEEKAKYVKNHSLKFEEYKRRMQDFSKDNDLPLPKKSSLKRSVLKEEDEGCSKDEGLPEKPPPHGRALFLKEKSKDGSSSGSSFMKNMAQRWKEMSQEDKQMYNTRCEKMKSEYKAKLFDYLNQFDKEEKQQVIKEKGFKLSKNTLSQMKREAGEPKMPCRSGFMYCYSELLRRSGKASKGKDRMERARKHWQELSGREKKHYAEIVQENIRKYEEDLNKWFQTLTSQEQGNYLRKNPKKIQYLKKHANVIQVALKETSDSQDDDVISSDEEDRVEIKKEDEENGSMFEMYG